MEVLTSIIVAVGAFGVPFIIHQMTMELRRIRITMESHMQMQAVAVRDSESMYKRKGVEL